MCASDLWGFTAEEPQLKRTNHCFLAPLWIQEPASDEGNPAAQDEDIFSVCDAWNALWFLWLWIQEERRVLLIIRGIFLIPRSDKGLEWQPKPVITVMNCETVPLFDSSDTCSRVSSACISRLVPKIISYVPNDFDVIWWCFDKLIGAPFVHHLQKWEPACVGKKFCAILIRNQPEVPDNFNQSLFSAAIPDQRLREQFLSLTELLKKLVAK